MVTNTTDGDNLKQFRIDTLPPTTNASFKVGNGRFYETNDYKQYKVLARAFVPQTIKVIPKPHKVRLDLAFHVSRDRDIDSGLKCLLDAFNGRLYEDDSQIIELNVIKVKVDKANRGVVVRSSYSTTLIDGQL